ncbi:MAG: M48 family metalloprotease [Oscillatoriales cyanobacterium C42_A2020_001]|nr:M48 family metalloprotease [Leptolyngbyaceae cyanobacterium C42_A2020_001]
MTATPESSSSQKQSRISQSGYLSDLQAGITAFKQGDYATASILLEPALAENPEHPQVARAQMAMAIAYEKLGEIERSAQLCQVLQQNSNPQVQDWAIKTLSSLVQRHPELVTLLETSLPESAPAPSEPTSTNESSDLTGFTPLDANAPLPSTTEQDLTQLTPLHQVDVENFAPTQPASEPVATPVRSPQPVTQPSSKRSTGVSNATVTTPPSLYQPIWRQAGRSPQWKPLGKVNLVKLVLAQVATAIALYFAVQQLLYWIFASYGNAVLKVLPRLGFRIAYPSPPNWTFPLVGIVFLLLFVGSRWILDWLLTVLHGLQPLSVNTLAAHSPETARSLNRFCQKYHISAPALGVIPTKAPLAFSYGILPNLSRIVVSQGLLDQLADDEIATVYAHEIGHLAHWTVPLMSLAAVILQLPYTIYWLVAEWGNRKDATITKISATMLSVISYGVFWLWRWVPLWLSRQRTYYSDRVAVDLTGNPNGYARALLKIAIGTANDVQQQKQTSYLLEGLEILTPLGHRIATPIGSLYPHAPLEKVLEWERTNPYRHWLAINNSHPPTGERLNLLMLYARHWALDTELDWQESQPRRSTRTALSGRQWRTLLLQGAPYFGLVFGIAIAVLLSWIGWIGLRAQWDAVSWMARDRTILRGLPLIGFCVGTLIRLNPFFPDIKPQPIAGVSHEPTLPVLLTDSTKIPVHSQPVRLEGTLLGRPGIGNALNQDLWLHTPKGMVQLHHTARLGPLASLFPRPNQPADFVQNPVATSGWFRRGTTPWLDLDTLRTSGGRTSRSYHPIWSFIASAIAASLGILAILNF